MSGLENDFSNWDPISKDYSDPRINTYDEGPGKELPASLQPANLHAKNSRESSEYILFVCKIPDYITTKGLENLGLRFGTPLRVFKVPNKDFGFIHYASLKEAQAAIQKLNNEPPFYLAVKFSKNNAIMQDVAKKDDQLENDQHLDDPKAWNPDDDGSTNQVGSGENLKEQEKLTIDEIRNVNQVESHENLKAQEKLPIEELRESLAGMARGRMLESRSQKEKKPGNRRGTDRTPEESKEENNEIFEIGEPVVFVDVPDNCHVYCALCGKKPQFRCSQCEMVYYCGQTCQINDWRKHKLFCGKREVAVGRGRGLLLSCGREQNMLRSRGTMLTDINTPLANLLKSMPRSREKLPMNVDVFANSLSER